MQILRKSRDKFSWTEKMSQCWYQNLFVSVFCPLSVIYKFISNM